MLLLLGMMVLLLCLVIGDGYVILFDDGMLLIGVIFELDDIDFVMCVVGYVENFECVWCLLLGLIGEWLEFVMLCGCVVFCWVVGDCLLFVGLFVDEV